MSDRQAPKLPTNNQTHLPKLGDRVMLVGRSETFVVVAVDEETASVSLRPDRQDAGRPVDKVVCLRPHAPSERIRFQRFSGD
jgi:hypothetical protein